MATDSDRELVEALKEELESEEVQNDPEAKAAMESALKKTQDKTESWEGREDESLHG